MDGVAPRSFRYEWEFHGITVRAHRQAGASYTGALIEIKWASVELTRSLSAFRSSMMRLQTDVFPDAVPPQTPMTKGARTGSWSSGPPAPRAVPLAMGLSDAVACSRLVRASEALATYVALAIEGGFS